MYRSVLAMYSTMEGISTAPTRGTEVRADTETVRLRLPATIQSQSQSQSQDVGPVRGGPGGAPAHPDARTVQFVDRVLPPNGCFRRQGGAMI